MASVFRAQLSRASRLQMRVNMTFSFPRKFMIQLEVEVVPISTQ